MRGVLSSCWLCLNRARLRSGRCNEDLEMNNWITLINIRSIFVNITTYQYEETRSSAGCTGVLFVMRTCFPPKVAKPCTGLTWVAVEVADHPCWLLLLLLVVLSGQTFASLT